MKQERHQGYLQKCISVQCPIIEMVVYALSSAREIRNTFADNRLKYKRSHWNVVNSRTCRPLSPKELTREKKKNCAPSQVPWRNEIPMNLYRELSRRVYASKINRIIRD